LKGSIWRVMLPTCDDVIRFAVSATRIAESAVSGDVAPTIEP